MSVEPDQRWTLTEPALAVLLQRLGAEPEAAAREYDDVRRKLTGFFERRGLPGAETLADQTIDRVARKLLAGEAVQHLRAYFYGVAKRVLLETEKRRVRERAAERQAPAGTSGDPVRELRISCLERCLQHLPEETRALIMEYYRTRLDDRQRLADRLGISYANLKTRAHRIRLQLTRCLDACLDAAENAR